MTMPSSSKPSFFHVIRSLRPSSSAFTQSLKCVSTRGVASIDDMEYSSRGCDGVDAVKTIAPFFATLASIQNGAYGSASPRLMRRDVPSRFTSQYAVDVPS